ncbi:MAG TPA: methyltransferase domain-containing protein [Candidatus Udaeobacter sp.]|nr:methyltransferase domain-containing protein [Candidatus Udaeobacter sp.]
MLTSDVPAGETLAFIAAHLPPGPARLLEVGCGDGALAIRLQARGHEIVAIDASRKAVARARARGLDARQVEWPAFDDPTPFDAVLFTRSLHHIGPLAPAVRRAREILRPRGRVLVEDFARHEVAPLAAEWLYQVLALLDGAGLLRRQSDPLLGAMRREGDALAAWQAAHDPHLHSAAAMRAALQAEFRRVETAVVPYLYRYVCARLPESARGHRLARRALAMERRLAAVGGVPLIGRRFVGNSARL